MLYTEDFTMRHYVGFSQIGSHISTPFFQGKVFANIPLPYNLYGIDYWVEVWWVEPIIRYRLFHIACKKYT